MLPFAISRLIVQHVLKMKCSSAGREVVLHLVNICLVRIKNLTACHSHTILHLQSGHLKCELHEIISIAESI